MIVLDASVHSEHVQVIRCDFKPGSVERSIDLDKKGMPLHRPLSTLPPTNDNSVAVRIIFNFRCQ
jgi:hypothetical protein